MRLIDLFELRNCLYDWNFTATVLHFLGVSLADDSKSNENHLQLFKSINEYFIPLRHYELAKRLVTYFELTPQEIDHFTQLTDRLASISHVSHLHELFRIEAQYSRLDPDADIWNRSESDADLALVTERFFDNLSSILHNAHYQRLTRQQIEQAVSIGSQWGVKLEVDFDLFEQMDVYVRGYRKVDVERRRWQTFFRKEVIQLPEFRRLVLAFRLKNDSEEDERLLTKDCVYLKNFKDIPETDLEILLPGSKVRLSFLDRGKILVPTVSGIAVTVYKIVRAAAVLTIATLAGIWGWVLLIGALLAYVIKSVLGFVRTKDKYRFDLTQNLYLKNLDNNAGVLYRVFNESEEQELCESLLGYVILLKAGPAGVSEKSLQMKAEKFLKVLVGDVVKFDPHDSLAKLIRLGLAHVDDAGNWTATRIESSAAVLHEKWQRLIELQSKRM